MTILSWAEFKVVFSPKAASMASCSLVTSDGRNASHSVLWSGCCHGKSGKGKVIHGQHIPWLT